MSEDKPMVVIVRRVFWTDDALIEVSARRGGGNVDICTPDPESVETFHEIEWNVTPAFARELGQALIAAADDAERQS